jgi:hypothetical protein
MEDLWLKKIIIIYNIGRYFNALCCTTCIEREIMYALGGTVIDNPSGAHAISPVLIIKMYFILVAQNPSVV